MKMNSVVLMLLFLPQLWSFSVYPGAKENRFTSELRSADLNDRVETEMRGVKDGLQALRGGMQQGNERLSQEIKALRGEMQQGNERLSKEVSKEIRALSKEIKDLSNKFTPIYVFLAVTTTATGMANFKHFVAFFK